MVETNLKKLPLISMTFAWFSCKRNFNPNKTELFEGSLFYDPPPPLSIHISRRTNPMLVQLYRIVKQPI